MFQGFSTAVPIPRPTRSQTPETRSKSTVSGSQNVMVGRARFELAVSWSQTRRFTELSYRPRNGRMTPLSLTLSPVGRGEYSNRQLLERARREHRPDRPGSVAVLGLLFWIHLPERPPRLRDQEHRVIPEALHSGMISPRHSPSKNDVGRPGAASAIVHVNRASHGRGWPARRSRSTCVRSFCVGPMRAE